jgi:hypothetical protein
LTGTAIDVAKSELSKYAPDTSNYNIVSGQTASISQQVLRETWTGDISQLALLCNIEPRCKGFTTDRKILVDIGNLVFQTGVDTFVKSNNSLI